MTSSKPWSQYWSQGHKTSFGNTFEDCYEGIIKSEWYKVFDKMEQGDAVLDLCTGNASLIRLAEQGLDNFSTMAFTGVDYAEVSADQKLANLANVSLVFNQNIEQLPFYENTFNAIISNFGIEYSDLSVSLPEASRVLKTGGTIDFLCHHVGSDIIQRSQRELLMLKAMHQNQGVVDKLENLIIALENQGDGHNANESETWRLELNQGLAELAEKFTTTFYQGDFISFLKFVLKPTTQEKLNAFGAFSKEMQDYQMRLNAMVNAAITPEKSDDVKRILLSLGFNDITQAPILSDDGCIAYKISAIKM